MFIMLHFHNVPWFWFLNTGNFGVRLPPGCSRHGVTVHCMCSNLKLLCHKMTRWKPSCMQLTLVSWYVASMLCCHCRMFILLVEYGLVHTGDCISCYFCMAESWARRPSFCLACNPFLGLCACTRPGRWCTSVVAIRSLSLSTNPADRRSQIDSLDSWCATRVSKTLDVVHRYALQVSNSDML